MESLNRESRRSQRVKFTIVRSKNTQMSIDTLVSTGTVDSD